MVKGVSTSLFILIAFFLGNTVYAQSILEQLFVYAQENNIPETQTFEEYLSTGEKLFRQQKFAEANQQFVLASMESPFHPASYFYLTFSLFADKKYDSGGEILRRTVNLYPDWNKLQFRFISFFPGSFEFARKKNEFQRWLLSSPRQENAYLLFGFLCQFSDDIKNAETAYRLVLAKNHTHSEALYLLETITKEKPNSFYPTQKQIEKIAKSYQEQGLFLEAINEWTNSFAFYPRESKVLYHLAYNLCSLKKFREATPVLFMAFDLASSKFPDQFQITQQFGKRKHLEDIISDLEKSIQSQPDDLNLLFLWSYFSFLNGEKQKVKIALEHLRQKQYQPAEVDFVWQKFLEGAPAQEKNEAQIKDEDNNKNANTNLEKKFSNLPVGILKGIGEFQKQNYKQAAQSFAQQIITDPKNSKEAQWLLAMASFANEEYQLTYKIMKETVVSKKLSPLDWEQYYDSPKTFKKHLINLGNYIKRFPQDTEALAVLGYLTATTGNPKEATIIFERLLQREKNELASFVLQLLQK